MGRKQKIAGFLETAQSLFIDSQSKCLNLCFEPELDPDTHSAIIDKPVKAAKVFLMEIGCKYVDIYTRKHQVILEISQPYISTFQDWLKKKRPDSPLIQKIENAQQEAKRKEVKEVESSQAPNEERPSSSNEDRPAPPKENKSILPKAVQLLLIEESFLSPYDVDAESRFFNPDGSVKGTKKGTKKGKGRGR